MLPYSPEGLSVQQPTEEALRRGADTGDIFQAKCIKCDEYHNLHVDLGRIRGLIPKAETAIGISDGSTREIAVLSRVGKQVSFQVLAFDYQGNAILSRKAAQLEARSYFLSALRPGDIIPAVVQNPLAFGVFCDIGCGFPALMRIDRCCVSRLQTSAERFSPGQPIYAAIANIDEPEGRIDLTCRELLGTWAENAALFRPGQTVTGIVRSVMAYGVFVELTPNLSGLAEPGFDVKPGDSVIVYIRSILADKHKIKLTILEKLPGPACTPPLHFFRTEGHIGTWEYYPGSRTATVF